MTHSGEMTVRLRAGELQAGARNEAVYRPTLHASGLSFLSTRSELWLAAPDPQGHFWVHRLSGAPGWLDGSNSSQIVMRSSADSIADGDWGLLAIDFASRRRIRVNGPGRRQDGQLVLSIRQAYANCPSYIAPQPVVEPGSQQETFQRWPDRLKPSLERCTALLVGSHALQGGADCSHRGGPPGFARLDSSGVLRLPDYPGNSLFNTWGNLALDPRGALTWTDAKEALLVQLRGRFTLLWDQPDSPTGRVLEFHLEAGRMQGGA